MHNAFPCDDAIILLYPIYTYASVYFTGPNTASASEVSLRDMGKIYWYQL